MLIQHRQRDVCQQRRNEPWGVPVPESLTVPSADITPARTPSRSPLITGEGNQSAIGTLVERSTRYVMLLPLPTDHTAEAVRDALTKTVLTLPNHLRRSLTSDQGKEMSQHRLFAIDTDVPVYFRDPHSPWQRGSNENTNGLLRQYFLKSTDLRVYTPDDLMAAALQLNSRPRKTLDWDTRAQRLDMLINTNK